MVTLLNYLKSTYLNLKIRSKFTFSILFVVSIPLILMGIYLYTQLSDMILADTIRNEQIAVANSGPQIVAEIEDIIHIGEELTETEFYSRLTHETNADELTNLINSSMANDFQQIIQTGIESTIIEDIRIFSDVIPTTNASPIANIIKPYSMANATHWHGIFSASSSIETLFCPEFYLSHTEIVNFGNSAYIMESSTLINGSPELFYVAIYFSSESLAEIMDQNLLSDENVAYIINSRDNIVATTNQAQSSTYYFDYHTVRDNFMSSNNFISKKILNENVYASFYSIAHTDWYMVAALPAEPILKKNLSVMSTFISIYILFVGISFLMASIFSHSITNRLSNVIKQMSKARYSAPTPLKSPNSKDEIGELIDTYNYMTLTINRLLEEQEQASEQVRIAEFDALQAQINPHFLYNTMDMINWHSQQGESDKVQDVIFKLSRFYKLTLSRKSSYSTIEEELEHITLYIELQNMRFNDNISLIIDIPDSLLACSIPKLTLQPLIENAITHGILEKDDRTGTIVIGGWQEDADTVVIQVSDDGQGMTAEIIKSLFSAETMLAARSAEKGSHVAVYNTHQRLQVLYGSAFGLTYSSTLGVGTDVSIRLPFRT